MTFLCSLVSTSFVLSNCALGFLDSPNDRLVIECDVKHDLLIQIH